MTLLLNENLEGPKTHALVIGVGRYPYAKAGKGARENLRRVPDLPSAADSAKLVCDWLLTNQGSLAAPLATLEVLISDADEPNHRYPWARGPVEAATHQNVFDRGWDWFNRLAQDGSIAFFYCCGHGASHLEQPVLFLEDLNDVRNVWSHINPGFLAYTLRKTRSVSAGFLFSDACGESVTEFEVENAQECRFFANPRATGIARNQVSLICAAAEGQFAYEGSDQVGSDLKFGRFTQAVLKGLNGSSTRLCRNKWGVHARGLLDDLKSLQRVYFGHWGDKEPFEPYQPVTPTDSTPIVFPGSPELPIVIITDPVDRMERYALYISDRSEPTSPWLKNRDAGERTAWSTTVSPGQNPLYAIAANGGGCYHRAFMPQQPLFEQWVPVP